MQRLPKRLIDGLQLTAAAAIYATVPANSLATISACSVTNTTATPQSVTLYLVPAGGAPGVGNVVCSGRVVAPGETYNVAGAIGQTLAAGGTVQALSDAAAALTLVASGYITVP
jgi:hypothetical protein